MKTVLIIPPSPWLMSDVDQPMTGILYIAAVLKKFDYEVQVCDLSGTPEEFWSVPIGDVYGITGVTPNFPWMKKIISRLKQREPGKPVVVGGVHATVLPEHVLKETRADSCVVGEGEFAMLDIVRSLEMGKKLERIIRYEQYDPIDFIPFPDRDSIDYYRYLEPKAYKYLGTGRQGSIITSRGCPYQCSYCGSYTINKGKVRYRTARNVIWELLEMKRKYGMDLCNFIDDTFILRKKRVAEICEGIKNRKDCDKCFHR